MTKAKKDNKILSQLGTLIALLLLCTVLAIASPNFLKFSNFMSILKQTSFNAMLSTGMLLCLITAGIDLSVGANATFCACMAGMMVQKGITNTPIIIITIVISGLLIGWINGMLLTRLHLPHPFVSTLGMKNTLWGLALLVTGSQMVSGFPAGVTWLGDATLPGGFPVGSKQDAHRFTDRRFAQRAHIDHILMQLV